MNKKELVKEVADKNEITLKDSEALVDSVFDIISDRLAAGESILVSNFGTFEVRYRAARKGINPATGESIDIAEQRTPAFKAGKQLKDKLR
jgi:DNA-binding protein HU-beta